MLLEVIWQLVQHHLLLNHNIIYCSESLTFLTKMSQECLFSLFQTYTKMLLLEFRSVTSSCSVKCFWKGDYILQTHPCLSGVPAGTFIIKSLHSLLTVLLSISGSSSVIIKNRKISKCLKIIFIEMQNRAMINLA